MPTVRSAAQERTARRLEKFINIRAARRAVSNRRGQSALHYKLGIYMSTSIRPPMVKSSVRAVAMVCRVGPTALLCAALSGCASGLIDKTMEVVGLKKPEPPAAEMALGPNGELPTLNGQMPRSGAQRQVALRIHAGQVVNVDTSGRSLAIVVRIYGLRGTTQFSQATYAMFAAGSAEKPFTDSDVVSSKEVVLVPGQKYEMLEGLPAEVTHLAVVALFRAPDRQRWRFTFDAKAAAKTGITLGVHGCAMSVAVGEPVGVQSDALRLAGVICS